MTEIHTWLPSIASGLALGLSALSCGYSFGTGKRATARARRKANVTARRMVDRGFRHFSARLDDLDLRQSLTEGILAHGQPKPTISIARTGEDRAARST